MHPVIEKHFERLQARFPGANVMELPSGAVLVTIPDLEVPPGWSIGTATVRFIAPVGYPNAQPDCFWISPTPQLNGNAVPKNARPQQIPETSDSWFWFSWHLQPGQWKANRDDLLTYLRVIISRLEKLE